MKRYFFLSIIAIIIFAVNSCSNKESDAPITENDPSGDYSYISHSEYYSDDNSEPTSVPSDGLMYVTWYLESTNINITINPYIGYSYFLKGTILESHSDTTTFRLNYQIVNINGIDFKIVGNNDIEIPNIGKVDGYFVQAKKIEYSFKSSNLDNYKTTDTRTVGTKQ